MFFLPVLAAAALGGTYHLTTRKKALPPIKPLTPAHQEIFTKAVTEPVDKPKLMALSKAFEEAGHPAHAEVLANRATLPETTSAEKADAYKKVLDKATESKDPDAVLDVAHAMAHAGAVQTAVGLEEYAASLIAGEGYDEDSDTEEGGDLEDLDDGQDRDSPDDDDRDFLGESVPSDSNNSLPDQDGGDDQYDEEDGPSDEALDNGHYDENGTELPPPAASPDGPPMAASTTVTPTKAAIPAANKAMTAHALLGKTATSLGHPVARPTMKRPIQRTTKSTGGLNFIANAFVGGKAPPTQTPTQRAQQVYFSHPIGGLSLRARGRARGRVRGRISGQVGIGSGGRWGG